MVFVQSSHCSPPGGKHLIAYWINSVAYASSNCSSFLSIFVIASTKSF